jgi:RNA polymerase sigma-70 factor (ECF subfamily)
MSKPLAAKGVGACLKHDLNTRLSGRLCKEDAGHDDAVDPANGPAGPGPARMKPAALRLAASEIEPAFAPRLADDDPVPPVSGWPPGREAHDLDALYRTQAPRLFRFFSRKAGGDDATDLVNEAFVRLLGIERRLAGAVERPAAYLSRIAANLLKDRARIARRANAGHVPFDETVHGGADTEFLHDGRETLRRLNDAVARLRPRTREIFLLHRVEGLTYAQIADEVGMSVKGVKKQMAKALFELRRDLGPL